MRPAFMNEIEAFSQQFMGCERGHDFEHIKRVRNWTLRIARTEEFERLDMAETAALLHDIGIPKAKPRREHGEVGAQMAREFLLEHGFFPKDEVDAICHAIQYHCTNRGGEGRLLDILRDGDMMDMFGAMGILRGIVFVADKPHYDPENIKGATWRASAEYFDDRFDNGLGFGDTIVDMLNFHISCYENLATGAARRMAAPMVETIRQFVKQLEDDVLDNRSEAEAAS